MNKAEIKLEELKFIKQQEQFIEQKINIIVLIVGIFISAAFVFLSIKLDSIDLNKKIWFFALASIAISFPFIVIFPKFLFERKRKNKKSRGTKFPAEHNLYKKEYQQWDIDFPTSLDAQIKLSCQLLRTKVVVCRLLIIVELSAFLGIIVILGLSL